MPRKMTFKNMAQGAVKVPCRDAYRGYCHAIRTKTLRAHYWLIRADQTSRHLYLVDVYGVHARSAGTPIRLLRSEAIVPNLIERASPSKNRTATSTEATTASALSSLGRTRVAPSLDHCRSHWVVISAHNPSWSTIVFRGF